MKRPEGMSREDYKKLLEEKKIERKRKMAGSWKYNLPNRTMLEILKTQGISPKEIMRRQDEMREMKAKGYKAHRGPDGIEYFKPENEEE